MREHCDNRNSLDVASTKKVEQESQCFSLVAFTEVGIPDFNVDHAVGPHSQDATEIPANLVTSHRDGVHERRGRWLCSSSAVATCAVQCLLIFHLVLVPSALL